MTASGKRCALRSRSPEFCCLYSRHLVGLPQAGCRSAYPGWCRLVLAGPGGS